MEYFSSAIDDTYNAALSMIKRMEALPIVIQRHSSYFLYSKIKFNGWKLSYKLFLSGIYFKDILNNLNQLFHDWDKTTSSLQQIFKKSLGEENAML